MPRVEEWVEDLKMPLTEHLSDLRKRIVVSLIALLIGFVVCFIYSEELFKFLTFPLRYDLSFSITWPFITLMEKNMKINPPLVFLAPTEAFWMHLKISMIAGLILALPVIFSQIWKFVSPGLLPKERKYVVPFVIIATAFFFIGAAYCFFLVLPFAMGFLLTYKTGSITPMLSVGSYVDFCLKFILAFGIIFELPIAIIFFTRVGLVTPEKLARHRKYAILLAFVVSAFLTPTPDAFNQVLMAVPMIVLYEAGILVSRLFVRGKAQ